MDSLGDFIYLLIGLVILIASLIKKAKSVTGIPKEILEDILPFPESQNENAPVKNIDESSMSYPGRPIAKKEYISYENTEPSTFPVVEKELSLSETTGTYRPYLTDGFDLRTAVIYSEILNTKYF